MPAFACVGAISARDRRVPWAFSLRSPFAALVLLLGCTAAGQAPSTRAESTAPPVASAQAPASESFDRAWGARAILQVPVEITLPDARAWHASKQGTFTLLEHAPTRSRLTLRVTLAPRLVRPEACESDARLARPSLPSTLDSSTVVERRIIAAPPGFDTRLVVGVEPSVHGGVRGYAVAVGAATSRCYVAVFETESAGGNAAGYVADRLALAVSGILETMRVPDADRRLSPPVGVK